MKERIRKEVDKERLKAMIWKSYIRVKRNPLILIMFHLIPIVTITLFTLTFLRSPHKMPIAIYPGDKNGGNLSETFIGKLVASLLGNSHRPAHIQMSSTTTSSTSKYSPLKNRL